MKFALSKALNCSSSTLIFLSKTMVEKLTTKLEQKLRDLCSSSSVPFRSRHSAALVKKGVVLALGVNKLKTHPLALRFAKNEEALFLHAEVDALVKGINKVGASAVQGSTLFVCRVLSDGSLSNSCPCEGCARAAAAFNLTVVYTTKEGWYDPQLLTTTASGCSCSSGN